ncbi:MAG TPA: serine/threonine-protein kinase [Solirubrobacteraceae bacterium]|nr:serine/threonine-protein kinase [Solirubrobacteraceae bacterium]
MATDLVPGAALGEDGRYRLQRVLGTGGMASVWLAEDSRLERPVALKLLADSLMLDRGYLARFQREARVAAGLSHPNLVKVFDFSAGAPRPYLAMEYVPGGTLADRLRERDRGGEAWDPETIFRELLSALAHVHASGIIHRDIKPGNLLIGRDGRTRLTDFGIARPSDAERLTGTGLVIGTARYLAPEILQGREPNERSDLYSCGVLLQECLRDAPANHLQALADRLTFQEPQMRPASATEVLGLLERPATLVRDATALTGATAALRDATAALRDATAARDATAVRGAPRAAGAPTSADAAAVRVFRTAGRSVRRSPRTMLVAALVVVVVVVGIAAVPGGGSGGAHRTAAGLGAPPAAGAPLRAQLDYLDRAIARARR